jgi:hypothetical protein
MVDCACRGYTRRAGAAPGTRGQGGYETERGGSEIGFARN